MSMIETVGWAGFPVSDMEGALAFYTEALCFTPVRDVEICGEAYERLYGVFGVRARVVTLLLGDERLELVEFLTPRGRPIPAESRSNDRWFQHVAIVVSDMDAAYQRLRQHGAAHVSTGPQTLPAWNTAAAGIQAFYFRDPDGHSLELIAYPPDKGDARWHSGSSLFLGIDHTAIAIEYTPVSLRLYRDILGLAVSSGSENYGTEQAHLNLVEGAHLRITGLRARAGIGIEFLEYLYPHDGRPMPPDSRAHDLWQWQTTLFTPDCVAALSALQVAGYPSASSGIVELPDMRLGFARGFMTRDADGHVLRVVEAS